MNIATDLYNIIFFVLLAFSAWCAWKISVADWRRRIIPDVYLFPLLLSGLVITVFFPWPGTIAESIIAATFGYLLAFLTGFIFEKTNHKNKNAISPIGFGDVKLITTGGIWLGTVGLATALIISCISGIIWGKYKKQKFIPFAPFFILGGILALLANSFLL